MFPASWSVRVGDISLCADPGVACLRLCVGSASQPVVVLVWLIRFLLSSRDHLVSFFLVM